jgi:hypothetical protein
MFIPYTNREIRVVRFSQLHYYYDIDEIEYLKYQLIDEKDSWNKFLKNTPLNDYWLCIVHKSAIHRLKCFYDVRYEVKNAIDDKTHLITSILLLQNRVMKGSLFRFINVVSSIIEGCSFGTYIIKQVQKKLRIWLIPQTIIPHSIKYWITYLSKEYGLVLLKDYSHFLNRHNLKKVVNWKPLLDIITLD